jgi:hypothetical protein
MAMKSAARTPVIQLTSPGDHTFVLEERLDPGPRKGVRGVLRHNRGRPPFVSPSIYRQLPMGPPFAFIRGTILAPPRCYNARSRRLGASGSGFGGGRWAAFT